jgi:hypothetical protein
MTSRDSLDECGLRSTANLMLRPHPANDPVFGLYQLPRSLPASSISATFHTYTRTRTCVCTRAYAFNRYLYRIQLLKQAIPSGPHIHGTTPPYVTTLTSQSLEDRGPRPHWFPNHNPHHPRSFEEPTSKCAHLDYTLLFCDGATRTTTRSISSKCTETKSSYNWRGIAGAGYASTGRI